MEEWYDVDGLRINCLTAGESGQPLILLHGGGIDSARLSWDSCLQQLAQEYRVFAPDLPGYGRSSKPNVSYSLDYYVKFLRSFLEVIDVEKAIVGGLSLGGGISLAFALQYPSYVSRLIQVASYGFLPKLSNHRFAYLYVHTPLNELSYSLVRRSRRLVRWSLESGLIFDSNKVNDDLVDAVYAEANRPGAGSAFVSFQQSDIAWNGLRSRLFEQLPRVSTPTLIINGGHDTAVPPSAAKKAHDSIPNSECKIIEEAKHWPQREKPSVFCQFVLDFLNQDNEAHL